MESSKKFSKYLEEVVSGWTLNLLCAMLSAFLLLLPGKGVAQSSADYTKTPAFFVHGHGMGAGSWETVISFFLRCGYPKEFLKAIQLQPNVGANIPAAEKQIAPAIEDFLRRVNELLTERNISIPLKTKVDLISHSMGSISARWYAAKVKPERVRVWLSIAGANHGTDILCRWSDPGARDLCPAYAKSPQQSLVQFLLNGQPKFADTDETPYGIGEDFPGVIKVHPDGPRKILYISIRTSPDQWIKPEDSPILEGAGGVPLQWPVSIRAKETSAGNILMTNKVDHDGMLSDTETMELVKLILGPGGFPY